MPDVENLRRMEDAAPEPRTDGDRTPAGALARRATSLSLVLEAFAIGDTNWMRMVRDRHDNAVDQGSAGSVRAYLERARNHHRRAALLSPQEQR
jgi:hypothetical protein